MANGFIPPCLLSAVGGVLALVLVLALVFVGAVKQYEAMLSTAKVPLCMRARAAEYLLWALFSMSTLLRKYRPSVLQSGMQEAALEKIRLLETGGATEQGDANDDGAPSPLTASTSAISAGGVCFIGSSTFTYWRQMAVDMAPLQVPVFNAAFGGSCTEDVWRHMERLCTQHRPQVVVYFCGTNNIAQGMPVSSVLQGFELFMSRLRDLTPPPQSPPHVVYLGLTLTPFFSLWNINNAVEGVKQANAAVQAYCKLPNNCTHMTFVSTDECSFARDPACFLADMHHLNDEGHSLLATVLLPYICSAITRYG